MAKEAGMTYNNKQTNQAQKYSNLSIFQVFWHYTILDHKSLFIFLLRKIYFHWIWKVQLASIGLDQHEGEFMKDKMFVWTVPFKVKYVISQKSRTSWLSRQAHAYPLEVPFGKAEITHCNLKTDILKNTAMPEHWMWSSIIVEKSLAQRKIKTILQASSEFKSGVLTKEISFTRNSTLICR